LYRLFKHCAKVLRGISRAPSEARWAVACWQSITRNRLPAALDERDERHLRGVRGAGEHRLAEEDAPEREAVESARERVVFPRLDRVREAQLVRRTYASIISGTIQVPCVAVSRAAQASITLRNAVSTRIS
jgi:hypothetical protein